jgi:hypothetical protein
LVDIPILRVEVVTLADKSTSPVEDESSSTVPEAMPPPDNFYSPRNYAFYAQHPYQPLEESSRSIRLLQVQLDVESDALNSHFTDWISLEKSRRTYTAISYCAGDPKDTHPMHVNRLEFNAFSNLARAIAETCDYRKEHHKDNSPLLWVDQICIN